MAEALGVAAGGIAVFQVATQVGSSIVKLKQLWDDLQDAPMSIRDLLDQIECLDPALWEADHTFSHTNLSPMFWDNSIAKRSTGYCRKALISLTEVVDELALQLNGVGKFRRKVASARVVLKKEQLKSLERRLQNAVSMLMFAQQSYLLALTRIQPHIIVQGFTEIATPLIVQSLHNNARSDQVGDLDTHPSQLPSKDVKAADDYKPQTHALTCRRYPEKQDAVSTIRFRLPTWLYRTTWELQSSRSYGGWKLNLRCYRTVPEDSEVFRIARYGDPKEMQMLLARGQASLYDRDVRYGLTLLHVAVKGRNWLMVKYLLSVSASPTELTNDGGVPIFEIRYMGGNHDWLNDWVATHDFYKLCEGLDIFTDYESGGCRCWMSCMSMYHLQIFQSIECPQHETTTLKSRLLALRFSARHIIEPDVAIPFLLQPYWSKDIRALCTKSFRTPLIHVVAIGLGYSTQESQPKWARLADTVIHNTPNIHYVKHYHDRLFQGRLTPLMALVAAWAVGTLRCERTSCGYLESWLFKIRSNGHDLEEYGQRENELLADKGLNLSYSYNLRRRLRGRRGKLGRVVVPLRLRGYKYGPEPKDWKILWSIPERSYAADFWSLVEEGPQLVPGAWVEDSDEDENWLVANI